MKAFYKDSDLNIFQMLHIRHCIWQLVEQIMVKQERKIKTICTISNDKVLCKMLKFLLKLARKANCI